MSGVLRVCLEALDRADLRQERRGGAGETARQLKQHGRSPCGHQSELTLERELELELELEDRAHQRATAVQPDPYVRLGRLALVE